MNAADRRPRHSDLQRNSWLHWFVFSQYRHIRYVWNMYIVYCILCTCVSFLSLNSVAFPNFICSAFSSLLLLVVAAGAAAAAIANLFNIDTDTAAAAVVVVLFLHWILVGYLCTGVFANVLFLSSFLIQFVWKKAIYLSRHIYSSKNFISAINSTVGWRPHEWYSFVASVTLSSSYSSHSQMI